MEHRFGHFRGVIPVQRCRLLINALALRHRDCKLSNLGFLGSTSLHYAH